ncbi:MAG: hypothetical protein A3I11_04665 [Elusimicrobia bacterium RIFCSPLOWO2_02_FULL_39_32]|nr:MAG: hypothetical protein A3B80_03235 [Elusimicrobia bacterium RIFCSPHIGHO2_02_FULL_39_36]OGR92983.1 MAG: hypothetical protein A3I11_04665 [Elusimicrobia bacterium RIFCSPLOWO2_02_FULL_39_32]OGR99766.1 MAG: hypothetical protein A3G85_02025 [Elusimicrobia bacterium RIFCSPLOWO2_12_FULL_39_28]
MKITFLFLLLFSLTKASLEAAFEIEELAAEASSLNNAYSALGDDPWAILYNPSQVMRLEGTQLSMGYSSPHPDFENLQAKLGSCILTRQILDIGYGIGILFTDTNLYYREITGLLNIGKKFGEKENRWDLTVGSNFKLLSLRRGDPLNSTDPALNPITINKFSGDLGLNLRIQKTYLGASMQNILPANFGSSSKEKIPLEIRVGLGVKNILEIEEFHLTLNPMLEVSHRNKDFTSQGALQIKILDKAELNFGAGENNLSSGITLYLNRLKKGNILNSKKETSAYKLTLSYEFPLNETSSEGSSLAGMTFVF